MKPTLYKNRQTGQKTYDHELAQIWYLMGYSVDFYKGDKCFFSWENQI